MDAREREATLIRAMADAGVAREAVAQAHAAYSQHTADIARLDDALAAALTAAEPLDDELFAALQACEGSADPAVQTLLAVHWRYREALAAALTLVMERGRLLTEAVETAYAAGQADASQDVIAQMGVIIASAVTPGGRPAV